MPQRVSQNRIPHAAIVSIKRLAMSLETHKSSVHGALPCVFRLRNRSFRSGISLSFQKVRKSLICTTTVPSCSRSECPCRPHAELHVPRSSISAAPRRSSSTRRPLVSARGCAECVGATRERHEIWISVDCLGVSECQGRTDGIHHGSLLLISPYSCASYSVDLGAAQIRQSDCVLVIE